MRRFSVHLFTFDDPFRFFNPLHTAPPADPSVPGENRRGVLYDVDGKFNYVTYSEQPRSYHPMIDIKKFTAKE